MKWYNIPPSPRADSPLAGSHAESVRQLTFSATTTSGRPSKVPPAVAGWNSRNRCGLGSFLPSRNPGSSRRHGSSHLLCVERLSDYLATAERGRAVWAYLVETVLCSQDAAHLPCFLRLLVLDHSFVDHYFQAYLPSAGPLLFFLC